ncbi:hypothetical protein AN413_15995 [Klebsiella pneumoniae]|nr:hypothetical protein AFK73_16775 [Klebsiella pneumoniae]MBB2649357.1 hypothetical protein [Klebsiella pneumoniae]
MSARNFFARASRKQWLRGGAYQAVDMYKRMSQASRKGGMFDDVMRYAKLWAEKQTSAAERREAKRKVRKGGDQAGLF